MFTWNNFDLNFIKEILHASELNDTQKEMLELAEEDNDKNGLISVMQSVCIEPDADFIIKYRTIIENSLLKFYKDEIIKICNVLYISERSYKDKLIALMKKATSRTLIDAYLNALYNISGIETNFNQFSKYKTTISLRMSETFAEEVPLYDFQKEAVSELKKHFITQDNDSGIMVMPTGSGKSRTASYFLIKEMISEGYQVLWIAHRHMLIDQAAECFYRFAGLSKINNPNIKDYRISCISGEHMSIRQADKDEVIVASIQSICRSKDHLKRILKRGKVMVVVDECHHALAPTYQNTLKFIKKCRSNAKLLGLTATPVRANDKDTNKLLSIFDNKIIFDISMSELITKKILADPNYIRVETHEDFEPEISYDEGKYIDRYSELPETLVNKIAVSKQRNSVILKQYLDNAESYGKTLIFALNVCHCRLLHEELCKKGVRCGLVYSGKEDNHKVINDFHDGKLDVLVNVNILTEGSDVPDIQTVFLTRPTASEGLLMQMIGRGMRGVSAKGTETVNIVDFHDKWTVFNKWLDPKWIIMDELDKSEPEIVQYKKRIYESYDWKICLDLYNSMRMRAAEFDSTVTAPSGWYTLIDENGELVRMLVFEDQISGLKNMMSDKKEWINDSSFNGSSAIQRYFSGFGCAPQLHELDLLIDNIKTLEEPPTIRVLKDRKYSDPLFAIEKAANENREFLEVGTELYDEYEIIRDLFPSKEAYLMELSRVKIYGKEKALRTKVEELPVEKIPFDRTPVHNINELYNEVVNEMWNGSYEGISGISWTDKPYKTYYGVYYPDNNSIKINSVLNSKNVPVEVIKFVIYHEMLHRDYHKHDKTFRELEHQYPKYEEWEHFLFSNMNKFEITGW